MEVIGALYAEKTGGGVSAAIGGSLDRDLFKRTASPSFKDGFCFLTLPILHIFFKI